MKKRIIDNNFHTYINDEIVLLPTYRKSSKLMSFSYRWKGEESIFAYAVLMRCDNIHEGRGCRILDCKNNDSNAYDRFFDRIETISELWAYHGGKKFDYLWFYVKDIDEYHISLLKEYIDGFYYDKKHKAYIRINAPQ